MQQQYTTSLTTNHGAARAVARYRSGEPSKNSLVSNVKAFGPFNSSLNRTADAAIFYVTKNGITWRELPTRFPAWQTVTVYLYFRKWAKDDTWILIVNELTMLHRLKEDKKPLPTVAIIDAQSVKNSATILSRLALMAANWLRAASVF